MEFSAEFIAKREASEIAKGIRKAKDKYDAQSWIAHCAITFSNPKTLDPETGYKFIAYYSQVYREVWGD